MLVLGACGDGAEVGSPPSTTEPLRFDPSTPAVSVQEAGADGTDDRVDTDAIRRSVEVAAASGEALRFPSGVYVIDGEIVLPDGITRIEFEPGAVLRQTVDAPALVRRGSIAGGPFAVTGAVAGATSVEVEDGELEAGDWLMIGSDDVIMQSKDFRLGSLRRVESIDGVTAMLDRALNRDLTDGSTGWRMDLAPPIEILGGTVEHAAPLEAFKPLVLFEWAHDPVLEGTTVRECGGSAVKVAGTVGGRLDVSIQDCVDDHDGSRFDAGRHYGYGIEATGPARDLTVTGEVRAVRHAFTTNGSYGIEESQLSNVGEPESIDVSLDVRDTTSSGLDTHEVGYGIRFHDCRVEDAGRYQREGSEDGKEGGSGVFIRAAATIVERCEIVRSAAAGVTVASPTEGNEPWSVDEAPQILDTRILDTEGRAGVETKQPVLLRDVDIAGRHRFGVQFAGASQGSSVTRSTIALSGSEKTFAFVNPDGVEVDGNELDVDRDVN